MKKRFTPALILELGTSILTSILISLYTQKEFLILVWAIVLVSVILGLSLWAILAAVLVGVAQQQYQQAGLSPEFWVTIGLMGLGVIVNLVADLIDRKTGSASVRNRRWRTLFFAVIGASIPVFLVSVGCSLPLSFEGLGENINNLTRIVLINFVCKFEYVFYRPFGLTWMGVAAGESVSAAIGRADGFTILNALLMGFLSLPSFWSAAFAALSALGIKKPRLVVSRFLITWVITFIITSILGVLVLVVSGWIFSRMMSGADYTGLPYLTISMVVLEVLVNAAVATILMNFLSDRT